MAIQLEEIIKKHTAFLESMTPEERDAYNKKAREEWEKGINKIDEDYANFTPKNLILGQPKQVEESKLTYTIRTTKLIFEWLALLIIASSIASFLDHYIKLYLS